MYERNAIVIDRHFANIYGYDNNNNIKVNSNNYFELVNLLEKYQQASETENKIMAEFEVVANKIKETQKLQEVLNKRNQKYNENTKNLFENLDEDAEVLSKKFQKLQEEIYKNNEDIKENSEKFVEEIKEFDEKSETRSKCGRERRIIENDYQKILNLTTDNFNKINKEKLKEIKSFIKTEDKNEEKEKIREKINKNGSKEKVPFDINVINTAIDVSTDIEQKKAEIFMSIYDKTMKLLDEIKKDSVKIDKHKKIVKDSQSKLEFLNVITEYIILFLDNERMNTIGGKEEHQKNMKEACENLQRDLIEIQHMYSLLIKEITGKSSKKAYKELYNLEYLFELQDEQKKFEEDISKINMAGTIIYPDYWRVEGMQKIYDTFKHLLTDIYEKDLTEYEPLDITFDVKEEMIEEDENLDSEDLDEMAEDKEENTTNEVTAEEEEIEDDVVYGDEIQEKEEMEDEEEFHWDDDDEDDELNFGATTNYILDNEQENDEEIEETEDNKEEQKETDEEDDESKRDKEIDEILGFFDEDEENDEDDKDEEILLPGIDDDDYDDDRIFPNDEDFEKEDKKKIKKKRSLFGRKKK